MNEKDPGAFRTISEVAAELDLPQHVLRFWETKFSQIRPTKRSSGRRFYRPEDVALVRTIRDMLYAQGYTIRGVQRVLKERGARNTATGAATPDLPDAVPAIVPVADDAHPVADTAQFTLPADVGAALRAAIEELAACAALLAAARNHPR